MPVAAEPGYGRPSARPRWGLRIAGFGAAALALLLIGGLGGAAIASGEVSFGGADTDAGTDTLLVSAKEACAEGSPYATVGDGGRTLTVEGAGDESAGLTTAVVACLLLELDVPDSVLAEISATRALDGRQSGEWGELRASWSYHPSSGVQMVITLAE